MKNKNFLQSLKCSFNGIVAYFKSEKNAKIELVFAILAFALGIIFKLSKTEFAILSITIFFVIVAEMINTGLEKTLDLIDKDFNKDIKFIKDLSAGFVLLSAINSIIIFYLLFVDKILRWLYRCLNQAL